MILYVRRDQHDPVPGLEHHMKTLCRNESSNWSKTWAILFCGNGLAVNYTGTFRVGTLIIATVLNVENSIKAKNPDCFSSVTLFRNVMSVLEKHGYRLHVRRFVLDLFEPEVMRRVVLGDDVDDVNI